MDPISRPDRFWHCLVELPGRKRLSVVNDLTFEALERTIIRPWHSGAPFTLAGTIVRSDEVTRIRIVHTANAQQYYARQHNNRMESNGIADLATNRRTLPFSEGEDYTNELLFEGRQERAPNVDVSLVEQVCRRLPQAARILAVRTRKGKTPFVISDEYDVQDLLQSVLRAYIKHAVQEDPLPKVAGAKSGRADLSIEALGVLIEVKYVHGPSDQKRIFEEFSQDLVLYARWPHLRALLFVIYNSADLRDAEALERLSGKQEVSGRQFEVRVILA